MLLAYHGATSMKADLETDVRASSAAGFKALELWAAKIDRYLSSHSGNELSLLLKSCEVAPTAINSIEFIGFRDDAAYEKIRRRCRELCAIARAIGCRTLVVVPSPTPQVSGDNGPELFFPWEKVVAEYVRVLRDLGDVAAEFDVSLAFEFIGFAWCSVRTPRGAFEIVKKANHPHVAMNLDCCHFYGGGGELTEIQELDPKRLLTFHLNDIEDIPKEAMTDGHRLLPGDGVIRLDDICRTLSNIGYDGVCSIELFRPEYWDLDPFDLAKRARKSMERVLSPYFSLA